MTYRCFHCHGELTLDGQVSRHDQCPHCGRDLRCCRNCQFYDEHAHNQCREPQTEYVSDREKSNFCEYFRFRSSESGHPRTDSKEKAKAEWEALFRKT